MNNTQIKVAHSMRLALFAIIKIFGRAVDWVYPPCCPFCDNKLQPCERESKVCNCCQKELVYITERHCLKCGKEIRSEREEYCYDCSHHHHYFEQARSILSYQKRTRAALYRYKKANRKEYASFFGKEICRLLGRWIYNCKGDYLIPIPMYYKKEQERGYNQAELLADIISKEMAIPVCKGLLQKIVETQNQKDLDREDRRKNLQQAFFIMPEHASILRGRTIFLVDDIYTTGATVDAASRCLKNAGAKKIYVITVATGGN